MDQSDTDQPNQQMPRVTEDCSSVNRSIELPSCVTCGLASAIGAFCIGLLSGAAGGLLLGGTAVVVLQSLELLADNRLLMHQLENYTTGIKCFLENKAREFVSWKTDNQVHDIHISIFAEMFGVISSTLSLPVGIFFGLSTYALVIKKHGEAAMGKALVLAGPVGLMGVTATGCFLGLALESCLSITLKVILLLWIIISLVVTFVFPVIEYRFNLHLRSYEYILVCIFWPPGALFITFITSLLSKMRLILACVFIPTIFQYLSLEERHKLTAASVPLMLIIADVFNIAGWPIVSLQSPASTNTSSAVLEGMFVGVLTPQLWTACVGMSLFVFWQRGGARTICVGAAASGGVVLRAIKAALPVLGPGPTIGALTGVAGAVGVSLAAGVAAVDNYGLWGRLGVTVGAAVGAFLSSCAHSGLSRMFMGLCAALIPAGSYLILLRSHFLSRSLKVCFGIFPLILMVLISPAYTPLFHVMCVYIIIYVFIIM